MICRRRMLLALAASWTLLLTDCKTSFDSPGGPPIETPSYASIRQQYNQRIEKVQSVHARGAIELRWTDEDGKRHFDTGDGDLWLDLPDRTALRVQKLGKNLMWIGSDGVSMWFFEFRDDETVLNVHPIEDSAAGQLPIDPEMMLTLYGLRPLPEDSDDTSVGYDNDRNAWIVRYEDPAGATQLLVDIEVLVPIRIERLTLQGDLLAHSELRLSRYERVASRTAVPGTSPWFPTLVDIYRRDGEDSIKLALRSPTEWPVKARVFDLEQLQRAYPPDRVETDALALEAPDDPHR